MTQFKYTLEPYKGMRTLFKCPQCNKREFKRYIDEDGEYLPFEYGRCNRESSCSYHLSPYKTGYGENDENTLKHGKNTVKTTVKEKVYTLPYEIVKASLNPDHWSENNFIKFLFTLFSESKVVELIAKYRIGTTKKGETIFWHIDYNQIVRQGQIVKYKDNGKRDKEVKPTSVISRMRLIKAQRELNKENITPQDLERLEKDGKILPSHYFKQVIYGEHLFTSKYGKNTVKIPFVESPKTAILCDGFEYGKFPFWLSYISMTGLSEKKVRDISHLIDNKKVYLFNDFHFSARMVNGVIPKRSSPGLRFDKNGELDNDFINKKTLIKLVNKSIDVILVDSPLGIDDESDNDIGDYLIRSHIQEQSKALNKNNKLCDFCNKEKNKFLVKTYKNKNICLSCYDNL